MEKYIEDMRSRLNKFFLKDNNVLFAYLYGSMNEMSDLDIAVYLAITDILTFDLHYQLEQCVQKEIDLLILNTAPIELAYSAHKGLLIFERDKRARIEFEVNIRKKYWDFVPVLRIHFDHSRKKLKELYQKWHQE